MSAEEVAQELPAGGPQAVDRSATAESLTWFAGRVEPELPAAESEPFRVVIIEDTPELRELLSFALEQHEFVVVGEAADGRTGVTLVEQTAPDLVLLDLAMPVMDGYEALPLVRRSCPSARVVVLSGFGTAAMSTRATDLGADGYLEKGQSISTTLAYLRTVLADPDRVGIPAFPSPRASAPSPPRPSEASRPAAAQRPAALSVVAAAPEDPERLRLALQRAIATLREPVLAVRALTEDLAVLGRATSAVDTQRHAGLLDRLLRETARLDALSADITVALLHERGLLVSTPTWCSIEELAQRVGDQHAMELACSPDTLVHVDADQVRQLLGDLARDAQRLGSSTIALRATIVAGELLLDVVDLGDRGAATTATATQLEASTLVDEPPLGRFVVRALAAAHGGTVEDTPSRAGGTTMTVRIPQPRR